MPGDSRFETVMESIDPVLCKIKELVREYDVAPADLLSQASTGSCCKNGCATQLFQGKNVCPVVYMARSDGVFPVVPRQNIDLIISYHAMEQ